MCDPCQALQPQREKITAGELAALYRRLRRCEQLRNINISLDQTAPAGVLPNTAFSIVVTVTNNSAFAVPLQVINVLEYDINGGTPALLENLQYTPSTGAVSVNQQSASWAVTVAGGSSATLQITLLQGAPDDPAVVRSFAYVNTLSDSVSINIGI